MPSETPIHSDQHSLLYRDGTSQAGRALAALAPGSARVDERSPADWLRFLHRYAQHLNYYDLNNERAGNWTSFFPFSSDRLDDQLAEVERFLQNPEACVGSGYELLRRPHFALLLVFLKLLRPVQDRVNQFTQRHLEFYFGDVLGFAPRPGLSGRVHVLIEPVSDRPPFLLPAGTLLASGQDEQGEDVYYRTDDSLIVSQAQVARCLSLHVRRTITGLDEIRQDPTHLPRILGARPDWWETRQVSNRVFLCLLQVALGNPDQLGRPLPSFPSQNGDLPVNESLLQELDDLVAFVPRRLGLTIPAFRDLMTLRRQVDPNRSEVEARWDLVNQTLEQAGQRKRSDPTFILNPRQKDAFEANLSVALNLDPKTAYDGLEEVEDIYGLDRRVDPKATASRFNNFVTDQKVGLAMSLEEFKDMMHIVNEFYENGRRILDLLRAAAWRLDQGKVIAKIDLHTYDRDHWAALLNATLGDLQNFPTVAQMPLGNLDQVDEELHRLETVFFMSAPDFVRARAVARQEVSAPWEWEEVYRLLRQARENQELARRRDALSRERIGKKTVREQVEAMVVAALENRGEASTPLPDPTGPAYAATLRDQLRLETAEAEFIRLIAAGERVATEAAWGQVTQVLEQAQRIRERWVPPRLEFESWENVYAAQDATQVIVNEPMGEGAASKRWRTFGDGPRKDEKTAPGTLGCMITSPLLALAEGDRTITLTLRFASEGADPKALAVAADSARAPFQFWLSSAEGLIELPSAETTVRVGTSNDLICVLHVNGQMPPIVSLPIGSAFPSEQPMLQLLLRDVADSTGFEGRLAKSYGDLRGLVVESIRLDVKVEGLTKLDLQNDDGVLDSKKPCEPFGLVPVTGARFVFAHPEICTKRLTRLGVELDWMGLPPSLETYYSGYPNKPAGTAALTLYDRRRPILLKDVGLFTSVGFELTAREITAVYPTYSLAPLKDSEEMPILWSRYWELELGSPDLQHAAYPAEAIRAAANKLTLNPPYTPRLKQLRLTYESSVELSVTSLSTASPDQFYHVEPFGFRPAAMAEADGWYLLPRCDLEGELYLGVASTVAPQDLAMLFQLADGSADPSLPSQAVRWSYLSDNQWRDLDDEHLLSDTTRGLLNTGIVKFSLPVPRPSTLLPDGYYWIRAAVVRSSRAVGDLVDVRAQAVSASRVIAGTGTTPGGYVLTPNQITGLASNGPEIKAVHQPYSSFGGCPPEAKERFATRVSERLRHKDRALNCWDYERLVLEAFPEIYKVKCLPVDSAADPALAAVVQVIVVPDIRGRSPFDPFQPKVPADTLRSVEEFLAARTPLAARVSVHNPRYCRLRLRFSVRLQPGCNPAFYLPRLNDELCRYLSPWAYDESSDIVFGGRISASLIICYVEQRPYVDYAAGMTFFLEPDGGAPTELAADELDLSRLAGGAPDLIVVSAGAHVIDLIGQEQYTPESFIGINYMKIELDFRVA